ncbi:MAG: hypothetical protein NVSMB49_08250 [Ktedonobacteraceae bacterium]
MKKRVLIIDDEEDIQAVIQALLETSDYEIDSAENGKIALEKLQGEVKPDIVLLDLMMPQMSGYSLLNELHNRGMHTAFSIIVMSADVFTKQQMERMGVKAFISKPFDVNELQEMIEAL